MGDFYFQWHITNKCNNRCTHCYQPSYGGIDTSIDMAKAISSDIKAFCDEIECEPIIAFTGGDPFQNENFFEILKIAKNVSKNINILGNPEVLLSDNGHTISRLKELGINVYQLSLDGLEATHDSMRYKGSFKKTLEAIEYLSKNGIKVHVMSTISKQNYNEMFDVMDVAYSHGAKAWSFARCVTEDRSTLIAPKEYLEYLQKIVHKHKYYEDLGKPILDKEPLLSIIYNKTTNNKYNNVSTGCGIGANITILPDATIMACRRHPDSILGKLSEKNTLLNMFLFNTKMDELRQLDKIHKCKDCELINCCCGCRAISYMYNKDIYGSDPQCFMECI
jgi:radical SAM protein with 4Fe4S-binding SPASM domain